MLTNCWHQLTNKSFPTLRSEAPVPNSHILFPHSEHRKSTEIQPHFCHMPTSWPRIYCRISLYTLPSLPHHLYHLMYVYISLNSIINIFYTVLMLIFECFNARSPITAPKIPILFVKNFFYSLVCLSLYYGMNTPNNSY